MDIAEKRSRAVAAPRRPDVIERAQRDGIPSHTAVTSHFDEGWRCGRHLGIGQVTNPDQESYYTKRLE